MPSPRSQQFDMPSEDAVREIVASMKPQHTDLYLATHRLIVDAVPEVRCVIDAGDAAIGYGARQFGYGGWGMAAMSPHRGWVSLYFMRGAELPDPDGVLEGSGKLMRHVKLRSLQDLDAKAAAIRSLMSVAADPEARAPGGRP